MQSIVEHVENRSDLMEDRSISAYQEKLSECNLWLLYEDPTPSKAAEASLGRTTIPVLFNFSFTNQRKRIILLLFQFLNLHSPPF